MQPDERPVKNERTQRFLRFLVEAQGEGRSWHDDQLDAEYASTGDPMLPHRIVQPFEAEHPEVSFTAVRFGTIVDLHGDYRGSHFEFHFKSYRAAWTLTLAGELFATGSTIPDDVAGMLEFLLVVLEHAHQRLTCRHPRAARYCPDCGVLNAAIPAHLARDVFTPLTATGGGR